MAAARVAAAAPALDGDLDCDVCIVGAGLSGLWTAYHLAALDPGLDIVVLEAEFAGFGASGRNGGWLSAELSGSKERYGATHGADGVRALVAAMEGAVDDVIGVCAAEGIDADIVKPCVLHVARTRAQLVRMRESLQDDEAWGIGAAHQVELAADEVGSRLHVDGALGATFSPHCARVHPAKLVRGVAAAVERRGVRILEQTRATRLEPGVVTTDRGRVRAAHRALSRGIHRRRPRPTPHVAADELGDDRHRAPARRGVGRDRLARLRAARRPRERLLLRAAHCRRSYRVGRPGHPVPVRLPHRRRRPDAAVDHRLLDPEPARDVPGCTAHSRRARLVRCARRPPATDAPA